MKKSQLKEAIKNEIRSVLSENMSLSEIQDQGLIDGINAITRDINMFGPPKLKNVAEIQTYVEAFKDGVEEEGRKISNNMKAGLNEEEEPTSDDIEKEKSIAAEKEAALKAQKALKDLKGKMKKKAKEYKEAEGKAKDKIKAELKKMTAEKKKLEKDIK